MIFCLSVLTLGMSILLAAVAGRLRREPTKLIQTKTLIAISGAVSWFGFCIVCLMFLYNVEKHIELPVNPGLISGVLAACITLIIMRATEKKSPNKDPEDEERIMT